MAQFDVHRNLGLSKSTVPYVVIVQSSQFDRYRRRVVVPLKLKKSLPPDLFNTSSRLNPAFTIERQTVVLHALEITSVPTTQLGEWVATLEESGLEIADALDELFTRSWK